MKQDADHLSRELRNLAAEMKRVAVLMDAAGYHDKYVQMSGAADMANDWADGVEGMQSTFL